MVKRFNGRIADVLRTNQFDSSASLQATLKRFVYLYNYYGSWGQMCDGTRIPKEIHSNFMKLTRRMYSSHTFGPISHHHIPQKNLHHKTPLQTLQQWYAQQPYLFKKNPRNHPGPDTFTVSTD